MALDKSRIAKAKQRHSAESKVIKALTDKVYAITDACGLDEDRMNKRVDAALGSEYGRVNGLINLLASLAKWPAEAGDGSTVAANRKLLRDDLNLDVMMLEDIAKYKGYHTFVNMDDLTTIEGVEPEYEMYEDYCYMFLETIGLLNEDAVRPTIDKVLWDRLEVRACDRAEIQVETLKAELERHKLLMGEE